MPANLTAEEQQAEVFYNKWQIVMERCRIFYNFVCQINIRSGNNGTNGGQ